MILILEESERIFARRAKKASPSKSKQMKLQRDLTSMLGISCAELPVET
jgi:hypothetical protein